MYLTLGRLRHDYIMVFPKFSLDQSPDEIRGHLFYESAAPSKVLGAQRIIPFLVFASSTLVLYSYQPVDSPGFAFVHLFIPSHASVSPFSQFHRVVHL